jgi:anti-sigma-K factor RskA
MDELVPIAALDALDGADRDDFESHLVAGCPRCERAVAAWRRDLAELGRATTPVAPDAAAARRLRGAIAAESFHRARRETSFAAWLAVAACLALVVVGTDDFVRRKALTGAARENARLAERERLTREDLAEKTLRARFVEDPDVQAILLTGLGPQPGAHGKIIYSPRARRAIFVSAGLAPLSADRQYELWFLAGGKPIAAGTFDAKPGMPSVFESAAVPEGVAAVEKFAVTIEPRGGVPQPTGPMVLVGG